MLSQKLLLQTLSGKLRITIRIITIIRGLSPIAIFTRRSFERFLNICDVLLSKGISYTESASHLLINLHIGYNCICELRCRDLCGTFHLSFEVIGNCLLKDSIFHCPDNHISRILPAHVFQHHNSR